VNRKNLVVIGGGPAGVEAALAAAPYAKSVSIVSDTSVGNWHKLMPSRVWLTALDHIKAVSGPPLLLHREGLKSEYFDLDSITTHVKRVAESWTSHIAEELKKRDVKIVTGRSSFESSNKVLVEREDDSRQTLNADAVIIASGSTPFFPSSLEPDGRRVFSPGTADEIKTLPKSILVVGDGAPGFEFVHLFSQLGIDVTWIVLEGGPRSGFDPEADRFLINSFRSQGVKIEPGKPITDLERHAGKVVVKPDGVRREAEMAFVTIGYRPNLTSLKVEAAGVQADSRGVLQSDDYGRTNVPGIYVVGDAKAYGPGNFAMARARVAALHAVDQPVAPFERESTVVCFCLNPQIAQVGKLSTEDGSVQSVSVPYRDCILTHITDSTDGFVRLAWDRRGCVVGGLAVGMQATEALAPVAMAIKMKASIDILASMQGPHPTISELPFIAARKGK
jgi:pyruvate/2-oxoglutarate dehydrogenase complex dihydrolipoamide dehydrogenase (E3) component